MAEFTGAGNHPLTLFFACLDDQREALWAADNRTAADSFTVGEIARDIGENGQHEVLFQAAYHADRAPCEKLTAALDAHKVLLRTAFAYSQLDATKLAFGLAYSTAASAAAELLPYLRPPGQGEAHQAHLEKLFPKGIPADPDIRDAVLVIFNDWEQYDSDRDAIRTITKETKENCPLAIKLESRIRRMKGDGRLNLLDRIERTKRTAPRPH